MFRNNTTTVSIYTLQLYVDAEPLSRIMRAVLTRYAKAYNFKYKKVGHVFQGRYKAILCQKDKYLLELVRYIHLNPVRANIVKEISEWKWSSHQVYLGKKEEVEINTAEVMGYFNKDINIARKRYLDFVIEDYKGTGFKQYPRETFPYLGDERFVETISKKYKELRRKITPELRISLEDLEQKICKRFGIKSQEMKYPGKERKICKARSIFCFIANKSCFHKVTEIAEYLNLSLPAVSRAIIRVKLDTEVMDIMKSLKCK